jgi:hypothetical protein
MIDIASEQLITLAEAAKLIPPARSGKKTHISTLLRWISQGMGGIKLEAVLMGARWMTSRESLQRFAERLTPDVEAEQPRLPRSPAARERANSRAEKELDRIGI